MYSYAAINKNDDIRYQSSSGGVFYELAKYILDNNGIVFGAAFDNNWDVIIKYIDNINELPQLMKSKYVKAKNLNTFKECKQFLDEGKLVLYSSTPCQIYALKHYLKQEYNNLITVDIACFGVPTQKSWQSYLSNFNKNNIKYIDFRDKINGWKDYYFTISYLDNTKYSESHNNNIYMQNFLQRKTLLNCCLNCKYKGNNSVADISIGDFWGITAINKKLDDNKGISAIIVISDKVNNILCNNYNLNLIKSDTKYFKIYNAGFQDK